MQPQFSINDSPTCQNLPTCEVSESTTCPTVTYCAEDSPANLIPSQASAKEATTSAIFGQTLRGSFARFALDMSLLKTCQDYAQVMLDGSLSEFSATLPSAGTMRNGRLYQLPPLARGTNENESGLLPTPVASDYTQNQTTKTAKIRYTLTGMARYNQFPTPTASDGSRSSRTYKGGNPTLIGSLLPPPIGELKLLPTPTVNGNNNQRGASAKSGDGLATKVNAMLPTPKASDSKLSGAYGTRGHQHDVIKKNLKGVAFQRDWQGQLNPDWVELLMGFPVGWTDCAVDDIEGFDPSVWAIHPMEWNISPVGVKIPNRANRLKCLGNAIVPQCAEVIGRYVVQHYEEESQ